MGKRALIVVDVQNDFVEGGALAVAGGKDLALRVSALMDERFDDYPVMVSTQDWHKPDDDNGGHFSATPDFKDTWVVHCVAETEGAELVEPLEAALFDQNFYKGYGSPSYSGFEAEADGLLLAEFLREEGVTRVDIVGIATDHCVKATALDALKEGFETAVFADYTVAVSDKNAAIAEMENAGVRIIRMVYPS